MSFVVNNTMQKGKCSNILSSTYQRNITKKGFLSFTIGTALNSKSKNNFAYIPFNLNLDSNKSISLTDLYQNKYHTKQLGVSSPITSNMGWEYNANLIQS
ncbi:hypothetical protein [Rickettsia endosymbiont of Proechinophthirus fluctus]|uniref:hypothetical protein n=1 Tax=Rickettsia endosymbiont of Proechinophthirus fluctus TaxID=1462733 RepID=UPI0020935A0F|nr:hypothetical protein [Rickettsia endosymbiont of Proechinophthirus fluctus]